MNIKEVLKEVNSILNGSNSTLKAKLVLCHMLDKPKEYLIIHDDEVLDDEFVLKYKENIQKIADGMPVQYVTGQQEFMKLNFEVTPDVLIPQPDTEILVQEALNIIKPNAKVLDMCTGSGAIAVSIAKYKKDIEVAGSDISKGALRVAKTNASNNNVKIKWLLSNMFENITEKYDVIVSNPPYIKTDVIKTLSKEVQNEPKVALDGGEDGLEFYKIFAKEAGKYLKPEGMLLLEIGYDQADEVCNLLEENFEDIKVIKDLSQNDRVIIAKKTKQTFSKEIKEEIEKLKVWDNKSNLKQEEQLQRVCVREAFLKSGSIADPEKQYHLEIVFKQKKKAEEILQILQENGFKFRMLKRRERYVLYIKEGEDISNFLAFIGASHSMLRFEEIRVVRQMRGHVNRKVNCETANLSKTVNASVKQLEAIEYLKQIGKFDELDDNIKEIANLRYENPDISLENLAKMLQNPISKSGANHRIAKIMQLAEELKKERGEI